MLRVARAAALVAVSIAAGTTPVAWQPAKAQEDQSAALQQLDAETPGTLINDPTGLDWPWQGDSVDVASLADPAIPGGGAANRYTVGRAGPQPYSIQASVPLLQAIRRGDTVTVGFWARAERAETGDGQGQLGLRIQLNQDPWPGFADTTVRLGPEWKWHEVSAVATTDIRRGSGILAFHLAAARQTIDIGQTIVVKGAPAIAGAAAQAPVAAVATEVPEPLRAAGQLIGDPANRDWRHTGPAGAWQPRAEPAVWTGQATLFTAAAGSAPGSVATAIPIAGPIASGERLLIALVARTRQADTSDGRGQVRIRVQDSQPPHDGFANAAFNVGTNWQLIRIPVTTALDLPAGRAEIVLDFSGAGQAVDIGPVYVFRAP